MLDTQPRFQPKVQPHILLVIPVSAFGGFGGFGAFSGVGVSPTDITSYPQQHTQKLSSPAKECLVVWRIILENKNCRHKCLKLSVFDTMYHQCTKLPEDSYRDNNLGRVQRALSMYSNFETMNLISQMILYYLKV